MNPQQLQQLVHIPLAKAYYCLDCQSVGNKGDICVACGCAGTNLMALAPILNRAEGYAEKETVNG